MRTVLGDREDDADVRQSGTADGGQSSQTSGAASTDALLTAILFDGEGRRRSRCGFRY